SMKISHALRRLVAVAIVLLWLPLAAAQNPPADQNPPASATPVPPGTRTTKKADPDREKTIYIPYTKLRETFEKEGRGVYLPYDQFQELWRKARLADQPLVEKRPPAGVLITDIESEASVERDVMIVRAKLKLEALGEGWQEVPLRLTDAAIRSAK